MTLRLRFTSTLVATALATAAVVPVASIASAQPPPAASASAEADALFKKGVEHYKAHRKKEAYEAFAKAFTLKQSFDIAANLGDVELDLNKPRDAAEHLSFAIANWPAVNQEARERAAARLAEAKQQVGTLRISVNVTAEISVNGKPIPTPPPPEWFVNAGAVTVEVKADGYASTKRVVAVDKGEAKDVAVVLEKASSSGAAVTPPPTEDPPVTPPPNGDTGAKVTSEGMSGRTVALIAGGAVTAVGATVAIVGLVKKGSAKGDADDLKKELESQGGASTCSGASAPAACADLKDALDRQDSADTLTTIGAVTFGVGVVGSVAVLLLWPSQEAGTQARAGSGWMRPVVAPLGDLSGAYSSGAYLGMTGSF